MDKIPDLILDVVMAALVFFALRDIRYYSRGRRWITFIVVVIVMVILFGLPPVAKGLLCVVLVMVTLRRSKPVHPAAPTPMPPQEPPTTETTADNEDTTLPLILDEPETPFNPDDITMSYAHPKTGVMHVDAALTAYISHQDGAVKARARRIIVAHLIKTAAFSTGHDDVDQALKEVITCDEPDTLDAKLQTLPEQLKRTDAPAEERTSIKDKVIIILNIVQVITEDPTVKSHLSRVVETMNQSEAI